MTHQKLPKAIVSGSIKIGEKEIPCAVLDDVDNTRVLTQEGFLGAIGRAAKAKGGEGATVDGLPAFLRAKNLIPFISNGLIESTSPIIFEPLKGHGFKGTAFGYRATLLSDVCWVYHDANRAGQLLPSQKHIGEMCEVLLRGLTNVAIEALVDEATGFQDIRARDALQKVLEKYCSAEVKPWVKTFDNDFYKEVFRLNDWLYDPSSIKRPGVIGHWTNDIYDRLAPGIRQELHRIVRRDEQGRPKDKLHQHLTTEVGHPELIGYLTAIKALMRASSSWASFQDLLQRAYPKFNTTMVLPFDIENT